MLKKCFFPAPIPTPRPPIAQQKSPQKPPSRPSPQSHPLKTAPSPLSHPARNSPPSQKGGAFTCPTIPPQHLPPRNKNQKFNSFKQLYYPIIVS